MTRSNFLCVLLRLGFHLFSRFYADCVRLKGNNAPRKSIEKSDFPVGLVSNKRCNFILAFKGSSMCLSTKCRVSLKRFLYLYLAQILRNNTLPLNAKICSPNSMTEFLPLLVVDVFTFGHFNTNYDTVN